MLFAALFTMLGKLLVFGGGATGACSPRFINACVVLAFSTRIQIAVVASEAGLAPVAVPAWVVRRRGVGKPNIAAALVVVSVGGRRGALAVAVAPVPSTVIAIVPVPTSSATDIRPATGRGIPPAFAVGAAVPTRAIPIGCSAAPGRGDAPAPVESA